MNEYTDGTYMENLIESGQVVQALRQIVNRLEEHRCDPPLPEGMRPWSEIRDTGLLWLINTSVFHPRGLALYVHLDADGRCGGFGLVSAPAGEVFQFGPDDVDELAQAAEAYMASVRATAEERGVKADGVQDDEAALNHAIDMAAEHAGSEEQAPAELSPEVAEGLDSAEQESLDAARWRELRAFMSPHPHPLEDWAAAAQIGVRSMQLAGEDPRPREVINPEGSPMRGLTDHFGLDAEYVASEAPAEETLVKDQVQWRNDEITVYRHAKVPAMVPVGAPLSEDLESGDWCWYDGEEDAPGLWRNVASGGEPCTGEHPWWPQYGIPSSTAHLISKIEPVEIHDAGTPPAGMNPGPEIHEGWASESRPDRWIGSDPSGELITEYGAYGVTIQVPEDGLWVPITLDQADVLDTIAGWIREEGVQGAFRLDRCDLSKHRSRGSGSVGRRWVTFEVQPLDAPVGSALAGQAWVRPAYPAT